MDCKTIDTRNNVYNRIDEDTLISNVFLFIDNIKVAPDTKIGS